MSLSVLGSPVVALTEQLSPASVGLMFLYLKPVLSEVVQNEREMHSFVYRRLSVQPTADTSQTSKEKCFQKKKRSIF